MAWHFCTPLYPLLVSTHASTAVWPRTYYVFSATCILPLGLFNRYLYHVCCGTPSLQPLIVTLLYRWRPLGLLPPTILVHNDNNISKPNWTGVARRTKTSVIIRLQIITCKTQVHLQRSGSANNSKVPRRSTSTSQQLYNGRVLADAQRQGI